METWNMMGCCLTAVSVYLLYSSDTDNSGKYTADLHNGGRNLKNAKDICVILCNRSLLQIVAAAEADVGKRLPVSYDIMFH